MKPLKIDKRSNYSDKEIDLFSNGKKKKAKRAEKDGNLHETRLQVMTWQAVFVPMSMVKRNLFLPTIKRQRMQKFIKK